MRIWDINPGYLNRQSLLGEHRELHGMVSIFVNDKKGYSKHPETLRWVGYGWALKMRHQLISSEMALRNFTDKTPVTLDENKDAWPEKYIDDPMNQFKLLGEKYLDKEQGRIPLPQNAQQLWSQHKYSILARNVSFYQKIGRAVSNTRKNEDFSKLAKELTEQLRIRPSEGGIRNALQHMWGYVSEGFTDNSQDIDSWSLQKMLLETRRLALERQEPYLLASTALSDLSIWLSE